MMRTKTQQAVQPIAREDARFGSTAALRDETSAKEGAMRTMTCRQLGGACDKEFHANSFDEIAGMSKQHGMDMFQKNDPAHLKAMREMQELMKKPEAMKDWFENKRREFEALPEK